jgi:hypothetical protein
MRRGLLSAPWTWSFNLKNIIPYNHDANIIFMNNYFTNRIYTYFFATISRSLASERWNQIHPTLSNIVLCKSPAFRAIIYPFNLINTISQTTWQSFQLVHHVTYYPWANTRRDLKQNNQDKSWGFTISSFKIKAQITRGILSVKHNSGILHYLLIDI